MSGHSRWSMIKNHQELSDLLGETADDKIRYEGMTHFCQGYILALDDLLHDLEELKRDDSSVSGDYAQKWVEGYEDALDEIGTMVKRTKDKANATLDQLQKKVDDAE